MFGASPSAPGGPGALVAGDWFWLLDGRNMELLFAVALGFALTLQFTIWAVKR